LLAHPPFEYYGVVTFREAQCITSRPTRTHKCVRALARTPCSCAGCLHVMPQAVVFAFSLQALLRLEHCASCMRFAVARTSQPFFTAVNRRRVSAMFDRAPAVVWRPVATLGHAAGSAAGSARRQLLRPSRLPSGFLVCSSQARCVAGAVASIGPLVPVSLRQ
jgi:hypothetical protein